MHMKKLVIKDIGPIQSVSLDLKKINVVIGPQSAGKSCILKIACFCAWAEKRILLEQGKNGFANFSYVIDNLIVFHKLEGYIRYRSLIEYKSDYVHFICDFSKSTFDLTIFDGCWRYKRSKISYIPSERNLVAAIPNWFEVKFDNTNIRNFIADWNGVRGMYSPGNMLDILDLNVKYYYDAEASRDYVLLGDGNKVNLTNASSGLQSVIPMWAYLKFLFDEQYSAKLPSNIVSDSENESVLFHIYEKRYKKSLEALASEEDRYFGKVGRLTLPFKSQEDYKECLKLYENFTRTAYSDIYLEEPEQNLFPLTQVELVQNLLKNASMHSDGLFIATHSPYLLYAINNYMLGYIVRDRLQDDDRKDCFVDPQNVAAWELRDGTVTPLQDEDGLIRGNYFDRVMKRVMSEFSNYAAYYG
ncbi:hypothetical protein SAMN05720487_1422 [Fibrobacter sp. UWT2]|uniref:ATP-binding protein n=1 Tax=Fibrobacter sp. UWT2 TaxID=1896224 RepID=UPI00091EBF61|nr:ATP-binding protein [Fibrobacter sp. UWT2]SHL89236.1 hypothetical protein SAMN05720487_1422 [Fibrobacter sp. UWT2]